MDVNIASNVGVSQFFPVYFIEPILLRDALNDMVVETLKRIAHIGVFVDSPIV